MELHTSCADGLVDDVRVCLDRGDDVNGTGEDEEQPPLYLACESGHVDVTRLLIDRGADLDKASEYGETPLYAACEKGQTRQRT